MDLLLRQPFYVIVANASPSVIKLAKKQRVDAMSQSPLTILHVKNNEYTPYPLRSSTVDFINIVHHKPSPDRLQQLKRHETVQRTDNDRLNNDWGDEVKIDDKYEEHGVEFLKFLKEFGDMWVTHLERITTTKPRTELTSDTVRTVKSALYRAGPPERKFAATELDRLLQEEVI